MEAQVDVLNGKAKALRRYRDGLDAISLTLRALPDGGSVPLLAGSAADEPGDPTAEPAGSSAESTARVSPAVSRMILAAQEDLRRDIARAMHDGPAQSLTNIVLQAQIVERLIASDPAAARPETRELIAMVQSTLDATKSFIFDVRPMVLDDLGLVPTLRRSARDRGRRAGIPVDFDSMGTDRRLPMELESGVFRMAEESLAGYLAGRPERVVLRLDWMKDTLEALIRSVRETAEAEAEPDAQAGPEASRGGRLRGRPKPEPEIPAALAAMIDERRGEQAAAKAASDAPVALPAKSWRDVTARADDARCPSRAVRRRLAGPDHGGHPGGRLRPRLRISRGVPAPASRTGQGLVEYGIILGLSALLIVILLVFFDDQVAAVLAWLSNQLP